MQLEKQNKSLVAETKDATENKARVSLLLNRYDRRYEAFRFVPNTYGFVMWLI